MRLAVSLGYRLVGFNFCVWYMYHNLLDFDCLCSCIFVILTVIITYCIVHRQSMCKAGQGLRPKYNLVFTHMWWLRVMQIPSPELARAYCTCILYMHIAHVHWLGFSLTSCSTRWQLWPRLLFHIRKQK